MTEIDRILEANAAHVEATEPSPAGAPPARHLAVVTCMDARIDAYRVFGLFPGESHVLRNAGGRITDDVLRSLALSVKLLGVRTIVVAEHTGCGAAGVSDDELRQKTGTELVFHAVDDQRASVQASIERLASVPYLAEVGDFAGFLIDMPTLRLEEIVRIER